MKVRTATLAAVLLAASIPSLSTTAQARPFGFHGGWGHGGWGHGGVGAVPGSGSPPVPWLGPHLPPRTTEVGTDMVTAIHTAMADTAMMTTTDMPPRTATAMRRYPTAMATHPTEFTGATVTARMGIGQDMAPTACPGSDMADIVPVSSGWDTAEECMEPTSGTVRPFVPTQVRHHWSPFKFRNIHWA